MNSAHWREVRARTDDDLFVGYLDRAAAGLFDARLEVMQSLEDGNRQVWEEFGGVVFAGGSGSPLLWPF